MITYTLNSLQRGMSYVVFRDVTKEEGNTVLFTVCFENFNQLMTVLLVNFRFPLR